MFGRTERLNIPHYLKPYIQLVDTLMFGHIKYNFSATTLVFGLMCDFNVIEISYL